jgi:uncharacterized protein
LLARSALILALWSLRLADSATAQQPPSSPPTVSVVGVATEETPPDIALVTFDIVDERASATDAESENTRVATAVINGLRGSGIEAKDIATVGLSLYPLWSEERDPKSGQTVKRTLTGYRASNTLNVRVRSIDKAGAIIAEGLQNGANYQGVAFDLSDRESREDALRVKAVANAMHRAELYAQGASMKLGALQAISADAAQPVFRMNAAAPRALAMSAGAAPMPIEPGLITLSESVSATWALTAP